MFATTRTTLMKDPDSFLCRISKEAELDSHRVDYFGKSKHSIVFFNLIGLQYVG